MTPDELKAIRKAAGLTQGALGSKLGKSRLSIANWENAKYRIPSDLAEQMATAGLVEGKGPDKTAIKEEQKRDKSIADTYTKFRTLSVVVKTDTGSDTHTNPHTGEKFMASPDGKMTHRQMVDHLYHMGCVITPGAAVLICKAWPDVPRTEEAFTFSGKPAL
jgi:transcriptional regulator with XRE-family HTH domain